MYRNPNSTFPFWNKFTVSTLNVEKVVKDPIKPVPIAVFNSADNGIFLQLEFKSHANKKLPNKLIQRVAIGKKLSEKKAIPIKYLIIAPKKPAIPISR